MCRCWQRESGETGSETGCAPDKDKKQCHLATCSLLNNADTEQTVARTEQYSTINPRHKKLNNTENSLPEILELMDDY